jgi:G3E family GTPase
MSEFQPAKKIKVYLLTGFLGAGKTTVLNGLLEAKKQEENIIIENEFGKVSLDAHLVKKEFCSVFEMNNGCICCSLDNELVDVLADILNAQTQPDNLFIEASGVADPGGIASLFRNQEVAGFFDLEQVLCVVDASVLEDWISEIPEVSRQLASADLIIINKKSSVNPSYLPKVTQMVQSINSMAEILLADHGKISDTLFFRNKSQWHLAKPIPRRETGSPHPLKSMLFEVEDPIDRQLLLNQLTMTLFLSYHQLYRMKGFIWEAGNDQPLVVQTHGRQVHIAPFEGVSPLPYPKSQLIFIGKGLERISLERIIKKTLAKKHY